MSTTTTTISNTTTQKRKMPSISTNALQPHQQFKSYHTAHGKLCIAINMYFYIISLILYYFSYIILFILILTIYILSNTHCNRLLETL